MQAEIKFTVFVAKALKKFIAKNPEGLKVFLAAMEGVGLVQRFCLVYRAMRCSGSLQAMREEMERCLIGLSIKEGSREQDILETASEKACRVRCVVFSTMSGTVDVNVYFFAPGDTMDILRLELRWYMKEGLTSVYYRGHGYHKSLTS